MPCRLGAGSLGLGSTAVLREGCERCVKEGIFHSKWLTTM